MTGEEYQIEFADDPENKGTVSEKSNQKSLYVRCIDENKMLSNQDIGFYQRENAEADFVFAGCHFVLPIGEIYTETAYLFGKFLRLQKESETEMKKLYDQCNGLGCVLEKLPAKAQTLFNKAYYELREILLETDYYGFNDEVKETGFFKYYYYDWDLSYEKYYDQAVTAYAEVVGRDKELQEYRKNRGNIKGDGKMCPVLFWMQ